MGASAKSRLHLTVGKLFPAQQSSRLVVVVQRYRIFHEKAVSEVFTCRKSGDKDVVVSNYWPVPYKDLGKSCR